MKKKNPFLALISLFLIILVVQFYFIEVLDAKETCDKVQNKKNNIIMLIPGAASSINSIYITSFVNSLLHFFNSDGYFKVIQNRLIKEGFQSYICPASQHLDHLNLTERSKLCINQIKNILQKSKVKPSITLIGHSMGGLIARMVATHLELQKFVSTVITISTPNKGTILADYALRKLKDDGFSAFILKLFNFTQKKRQYFVELRVKNAKNNAIFNTLKIKKIHYYSIVTGLGTYSWDTRFTGQIIEQELINSFLNKSDYGVLNDGVVPSYSQDFGQRVASFEMSHFESACVDLYKNSKGCKQILNFLVNFLNENICNEIN